MSAGGGLRRDRLIRLPSRTHLPRRTGWQMRAGRLSDPRNKEAEVERSFHRRREPNRSQTFGRLRRLYRLVSIGDASRTTARPVWGEKASFYVSIGDASRTAARPEQRLLSLTQVSIGDASRTAARPLGRNKSAASGFHRRREPNGCQTTWAKQISCQWFPSATRAERLPDCHPCRYASMLNKNRHFPTWIVTNANPALPFSHSSPFCIKNQDDRLIHHDRSIAILLLSFVFRPLAADSGFQARAVSVDLFSPHRRLYLSLAGLFPQSGDRLSTDAGRHSPSALDQSTSQAAAEMDKSVRTTTRKAGTMVGSV